MKVTVTTNTVDILHGPSEAQVRTKHFSLDCRIGQHKWSLNWTDSPDDTSVWSTALIHTPEKTEHGMVEIINFDNLSSLVLFRHFMVKDMKITIDMVKAVVKELIAQLRHECRELVLDEATPAAHVPSSTRQFLGEVRITIATLEMVQQALAQ